jgi:hypothetical protein
MAPNGQPSSWKTIHLQSCLLATAVATTSKCSRVSRNPEGFVFIMALAGLVDLTDEQRAELWTFTNNPGVAAALATRAGIVLWDNEGVHGC